MREFCAILGTLAFLSFGIPIQVFAQDVTLTSRDGSISVSGIFLGFDGDFYRVATDFGPLTIDGSGVLCEGPGCPDLNSFYPIVRFSGDGAVSASLMPALVSAFAARYGYNTEVTVGEYSYSVLLTDAAQGQPAAQFDLAQTSSEEGFADLLTENTDIVVSLREATAQEKKLARSEGIGDLSDAVRARVLGLDAIVPTVSLSNPLTTISLTDLEKLLSGKVKNWKEIGGQDAPVSLLLDDEILSEGSPLRALLPSIKPDVTTNQSLVLRSSQDAVDALERHPYGIAFGRLSTVGRAKVMGLTGACGFYTDVNSADVKTEDYPLTQPMFLYTPARRLPKIARDFLDYVLSPSAQIVVARSPFVDQAIEELSFRDHGQRFANAIRNSGTEISLDDLKSLIETLHGAHRLSLGFRFEGGTAKLDAQSRSNVQLLVRLIEAGVYDRKDMIFAGFSDGQGAALANKALSVKRAQAVRASIIAALQNGEEGNLNMTVQGFGEAMPLACDDVAWGRELNRRVEIWVRDKTYK
ncbi:phosphate ABC transporter substrate-binding protein (PhoT family) [Pacificibacter maritimus]|uniref:Phosphate ABC transporter substrate-binding protein (PhoT family) n=1 Tax=Pacificibacter maritimus TaxID=762213 RepID=A0A3N4UVE3_9RHOB|nr:phosphate ABC transporter substrate-binding/OmpA family protein [Pacificibacter maritimus]RPE64674.1 phosphate ABC transporter substrate-binding protein (PhoT family) [Pacificibacter maritimus]